MLLIALAFCHQKLHWDQLHRVGLWAEIIGTGRAQLSRNWPLTGKYGLICIIFYGV